MASPVIETSTLHKPSPHTSHFLLSLVGLAAVLLITGCNPFEDEAQKKVKYFLKDPKSADFRNAKKVKPPSQAEATAYCGEVNSKNAYGAFSGFEKYIVDGRLVMFELSGEAYYDLVDGEEDWTRKAVRDSGIAVAKMQVFRYKTEADTKNLKARRQKLDGSDPSASETNTPFGVMWKYYCE